MREIRQSGSEGGGAETNRLSLPLFCGLSRLQPLKSFSFNLERHAPDTNGVKPY